MLTSYAPKAEFFQSLKPLLCLASPPTVNSISENIIQQSEIRKDRKNQIIDFSNDTPLINNTPAKNELNKNQIQNRKHDNWSLYPFKRKIGLLSDSASRSIIHKTPFKTLFDHGIVFEYNGVTGRAWFPDNHVKQVLVMIHGYLLDSCENYLKINLKRSTCQDDIFKSPYVYQGSLIQDLNKQGTICIGIDLPGHGLNRIDYENARPFPPSSVLKSYINGNLANYMFHLRNAIDSELNENIPLNVIGTSFGGGVASYISSKLNQTSKKTIISKVCLVAPLLDNRSVTKLAAKKLEWMLTPRFLSKKKYTRGRINRFWFHRKKERKTILNSTYNKYFLNYKCGMDDASIVCDCAEMFKTQFINSLENPTHDIYVLHYYNDDTVELDDARDNYHLIRKKYSLSQYKSQFTIIGGNQDLTTLPLTKQELNDIELNHDLPDAAHTLINEPIGPKLSHNICTFLLGNQYKK